MIFIIKHKSVKIIASLLCALMVFNIAEPAFTAFAEQTAGTNQTAKEDTNDSMFKIDYQFKPSANLAEALKLLEEDLMIYNVQQQKADRKVIVSSRIERRYQEIKKHVKRINQQLEKDEKKLDNHRVKERLNQLRNRLNQEIDWYKNQLSQILAHKKENTTARQRTVTTILNKLRQDQPKPVKSNGRLAHRALMSPETPALKDQTSIQFQGQTFELQNNNKNPIILTPTQEIIDFVNRLDRDAFKIYQYIRNHFDYEPYVGFVKGPNQTLMEKAGNDYDLGALLVTALRAAGYQARFAKGRIRLTIQQAMDWVGTKDPKLAAAFFIKNGIPAQIEMVGENYEAVVMDHLWVQVYVPYHPFRGTKRTEPDSWLNLDPSFKNYRIISGKDVAAEAGIDPNQFLRSLKAQAYFNEEQSFVTGLPEDQIYDQLQKWSETIRRFADRNGMSADTIYQSRNIIPEELNILPAGLPYDQVTPLQVFDDLTISDCIRFAVKGLNPDQRISLEYENTIDQLCGKRLTISYRPATADDEQVIKDYAIEPQFPVYLVKVIPQIKLDGQLVASGAPINMGEKQSFEFSYLYPDGSIETSSKDLIAGTISAVVIDLQKMPAELIHHRSGDLKLRLQQVENNSLVANDDLLGEILHQWGLNYYLEADRLNAITASALDVVAIRQPSHMLVTLDFSVEELFGVPYRIQGMKMASWIGRDLLVPVSKSGIVEKEKQFLITASLTANALQHGIFEQSAVGGDAISVLKVIQQANASQIPIITLTIDNFEKLLPYLPQLTETQKTEVQNYIQSGHRIIIPQQSVRVGSWSGNGYLIFDPFSYATEYRFLNSEWSGVSGNSLLAAGDLFYASTRQLPLGKALTVWAGQLEQAMESFVWQYIPAASVINSWFLNEAAIDQISFVAAAILLSCPIADFVTRPTIIQAVISTPAFSPNGDERLDTVSITAAITRQAAWKITVTDSSGATVKELTGNGQTIAAIWDGMDSAGTLAVEGGYNFIITALDNEYSTQARPVVLEADLDITAPVIGLSRPESGSQVEGYLNIIGTVEDPNLTQYLVQIGEGNNPTDWQIVHNGDTSIIEGSLGLIDTTRLNNQSYTIRISAQDSAGNQIASNFNFTVNNSNQAPRIKITSPSNGDTLSGEISYTAEVTDDHPDGNKVTIYLDGKALNEYTSPPYQGSLSTYHLSNGLHQIYAEVIDSGGIFAKSETVEFTVNNFLSELKIQPNPFSPNGDGYNDATQTLARLAAEADWQVVISDQFNNPVRSFSGRGSLINPIWDGKNNQNQVQPEGDYLVRIDLLEQELRVETSVAVCNSLDSPQLAITAPEQSAKVSGLVEIKGTVFSPQLKHYRLEYRPVGANRWTLISEGTHNVIDGIIGVWDTTTLPNNPYQIRLGAEDVLGQIVYTLSELSVYSELKIGNYHLELLDLQMEAGQLPAMVARSYDTLNKDQSGEFGYGWTSLIRSADVVQAENWDITLTLPNGRRTTFAFTPRFPGNMINQVLAYPEYTSISGYYDQLDVVDVNVVVRGSDGGYYATGPYGTDVYEPRQFKLTGVDSLVYRIDKEAGVTQVTDFNNNSINFDTNGIHHTSGKSIVFERDAAGRIIKATDPDGRFVQYTYDEKGDLVKFTDANGGEYTYVYHEHALMKIIGPEGKEIATQEYDESGRLKEVKDALGYSVRMLHDLNTRTETVIDRNGNSTFYRYDQQGNVIEQIDALGNRTAYSYDWNNNLLIEINPLGETIRRTYNAQGNLETETDPLGNVTNYRMMIVNEGPTLRSKHSSLPREITDPLGHKTSFDYKSYQLTKYTDPLGNSITFDYDDYGRSTQMIDPLGQVTRYEYADNSGNPTKVTDPAGNVYEYTYDSGGRVLTETRYQKDRDGNLRPLIIEYEYNKGGKLTKRTDPDGYFTQYEYNEYGQKTAEIDRAGRRTEYRYNDRGDLKRIDYADGTFEEYEYDANGNKTSERDQNGEITQYLYDALNRLVKTIYPDGSTTSTMYDAAGREIAFTDQRGYTTKKVYDKAGRVISEIDPLGNTTTYEYDAAGNRIKEVDPLGNVTSNVYDAGNRLVKTVAPNGAVITYSYESYGYLTGIANQNGYEIKYGYDSLGRLNQVIDALNGITKYQYNEAGKMTAQIDAKGRITRFAYDSMNRLVEKTLPLGQKETYTYNPDGTMASQTDFNGHTTTFEYDPNSGRLLAKKYHDGTETRYTYYTDGRLKTATAPGGLTTHYEYYSMGRLKKLTDPYNKTIEYGYDKAGNRIKLTSSGGTVNYTFDDLNRISAVTDQAGRTTRYEYDANGRQKRVLYGNGVQASYTYDAVGQLKELINKGPDGSIISSHKYGLDAVGQRIRIEEQDSTVEYQYDALNRLIYEKRTGSVEYEASYTYDAVGNRLTKTGTDGSFTYSYDDNDRLLSDGKYTYNWDNNGNQISKISPEETINYIFDAENRLIQADGPDGTVVFAYDANGNRIARTTQDGTTQFLIDPNLPFAQVLEEVTNNATKVYAYGNDLFKMEGPDGTRWYTYDGLGSTRGLTDENGTLTDKYVYEGFGRLIQQTGNTRNEFLFTGEQFEQHLNMYYLRARYYEQGVGRFINRDIWNGIYFNPISLHKYIYTNSNPVNNIDPTGQFTLAQVLGTFTILGALTGMASYTFSRGFGGAEGCSFTWKGFILWTLTGAAIGATVAFGIYYFMGTATYATTVSTISTTAGVVSKSLADKWTSTQNLINHFGVHGKQIANILGEKIYTLEQYAADAQWVRETGIQLTNRYGQIVFIKFMGNTDGGAKFAYVVINEVGKIITFFPMSFQELSQYILGLIR